MDKEYRTTNLCKINRIKMTISFLPSYAMQVSVPSVTFNPRGNDFEVSIARQTLFLGLVLITLQVLDGVLTHLGILKFGMEAEGNPMLYALMVKVGVENALIITKVLVSLVIVGLMFAASKLAWVNNALAAVCAVYTVMAVLPWTYLLAA